MAEQSKLPKWFSFAFKAPVAVVGILGCVYGVLLVIRFNEDTTAITNAAFVVMATFATLSFSFARVIESETLKDRVMYAGERLLHGALLVLVTSVLKYFIFLLYKIPTFAGLPILKLVVSFTFSLTGASIFLIGVIFAHTGLRILNDVLLLRFARYKDWYNLW